MARRVFFSFDFEQDIFRVNQVRNANVVLGVDATGFYDHSEYEKIKRGGVDTIKRSILDCLEGTSVTIVLLGGRTASRLWVQFEVAESIRRANGFLGIWIHDLIDPRTHTRSSPGPIPSVPKLIRFPTFPWGHLKGRLGTHEPLRAEIEAAGQRAVSMRSHGPLAAILDKIGGDTREAVEEQLRKEEAAAALRRLVAQAQLRATLRHDFGARPPAARTQAAAPSALRPLDPLAIQPMPQAPRQKSFQEELLDILKKRRT